MEAGILWLMPTAATVKMAMVKMNPMMIQQQSVQLRLSSVWRRGVHSRMSVGIFLTCTKPDMFRYSWLSDMMIRLNKIYLFIYQFNCRVKAIAVGERGKRETRQDGKGQDWKVIKTAWNRLSRWCLYS